MNHAVRLTTCYLEDTDFIRLHISVLKLFYCCFKAIVYLKNPTKLLLKLKHFYFYLFKFRRKKCVLLLQWHSSHAKKKEKRKKRRKKKRPIICIVMYETHTESFAMAGVYAKLLIK